jgi:nucleotide-binding universal stress UspA family protein
MTAGHPESQLPNDAIVVGYDKTDVAGRALDWAAEHAARQGRPLAIIDVTGSLATVGTIRRNLPWTR